MSRVCASPRTGASIHVFADDHCPPHVHARHRGEGWVARVRFSFVGDTITVISVTPIRNTPLPSVVGLLLDDVQDALPFCRAMWWTMHETTCLTNRWAVHERHSVTLLAVHRPNAEQVATATYDPASRRLSLIFKSGAALVIAAGNGVDPR